jgi:hypothetical protein
MKCKNL